MYSYLRTENYNELLMYIITIPSISTGQRDGALSQPAFSPRTSMQLKVLRWANLQQLWCNGWPVVAACTCVCHTGGERQSC